MNTDEQTRVCQYCLMTKPLADMVKNGTKLQLPIRCQNCQDTRFKTAGPETRKLTEEELYEYALGRPLGSDPLTGLMPGEENE